jgi:delta 1-pyrroline-5-carboxylate dehydrogenase
MNIDDIIGYFTYRSFQNQPVGSPNDILWGEGELVLFITDEGDVIGTLAFPAESGAEQKDFMETVGYMIEAFMAWYSNNVYEKALMLNRIAGPYMWVA